MIEVGSYDTDPGEFGEITVAPGCLSLFCLQEILSPLIFMMDAPALGKLTVMTPTYVLPCWLEGSITEQYHGGNCV